MLIEHKKACSAKLVQHLICITHLNLKNLIEELNYVFLLADIDSQSMFFCDD